MSKFRKLVETASMKPNAKELMYGLTDIFEDHLSKLEAVHPEYYWDVIHELHELVNGAYFDEPMAVWAVSKMENEDGTVGGHWSETDTTSVAASEGIVFDKFNKWDWYYVLNMIYSDYYNVVGGDTSMYIKLARTFLMDRDAPEGKAFKYFMAMC